MGYWQSTVVPKIKKVFEKNSAKKAAAAEACKSFDDSKEEYSKEFEEKKADLQPKVIEIYEAAAIEIKSLVKELKAKGLKKHSSGIAKFLDELGKLDFPGSKPAYEATTKFGATYVREPIFFVFEKVSTLIPTEVSREVEVPAPETTAATTITEETSGAEEKEIVGEVEKKVEAVAAPVEPEKTETVVAEEVPPPKMEEPKA